MSLFCATRFQLFQLEGRVPFRLLTPNLSMNKLFALVATFGVPNLFYILWKADIHKLFILILEVSICDACACEICGQLSFGLKRARTRKSFCCFLTSTYSGKNVICCFHGKRLWESKREMQNLHLYFKLFAEQYVRKY